MTKYRQTRKRKQKGGAWYNPLSWGQSQNINGPKKSWGEWFSGTSNNVIQTADNAVGSAANFISTGAQNTYNSASSMFSSGTPSSSSLTTQPMVSSPSTNSTSQVSDNPNLNPNPNPNPNSSFGGKRKRRKFTRRMKGGYKGNLAYNAAPIKESNVAYPTYWVSAKTNQPLIGGSKRRFKKKKNCHKSCRHKK